MTGRSLLALVAFAACAGAEGPPAVDAPYSCYDPPISDIVVEDDFRAKFYEFSDARDPAERKALANRLSSMAATRTERGWANLANATVLTDEHMNAEAAQLYEEVVASRKVSRKLSDLARVGLARLAMQREDDDAALAWLEPMVKGGCKVVEDSARRLLAYLYQEKGRLEEALEQVDKVSASTAEDVDHWRAVRIDFRCSLEGDAGCAQQIACLAGAGELGVEGLATANRQLARMRSSEAGQAALASIQGYGVLDEHGNAVVSKVESPVTVRRGLIDYPRDAARLGVNGYVDVALVIDEQGKVRSAEVWDARPRGFFERAATRSARNSTFKPKFVDGQSVESRTVLRYVFKLVQSGEKP